MSENEGQPGLRARLRQEARRISSQHRQLDSFYQLLAKALVDGDQSDARVAFMRFDDALDAHFTVEERIHFPALHGLLPDFESELIELVREHGDFRAQLVRLRALVESDLAAAAELLDTFVTALAAHEGREEHLLQGIRGSLAPES